MAFIEWLCGSLVDSTAPPSAAPVRQDPRLRATTYLLVSNASMFDTLGLRWFLAPPAFVDLALERRLYGRLGVHAIGPQPRKLIHN